MHAHSSLLARKQSGNRGSGLQVEARSICLYVQRYSINHRIQELGGTLVWPVHRYGPENLAARKGKYGPGGLMNVDDDVTNGVDYLPLSGSAQTGRTTDRREPAGHGLR
jgi:hypothetical protein